MVRYFTGQLAGRWQLAIVPRGGGHAAGRRWRLIIAQKTASCH
jgi:hypothetical protein